MIKSNRPEPFTKKHLYYVLTEGGLSPKAKALLNCMWTWKNAYNHVVKSYSELRTLSGCIKQQTFIKAKNELVEKKLLTIQKQHSKKTGNNLSNRYILKPPKITLVTSGQK